MSLKLQSYKYNLKGANERLQRAQKVIDNEVLRRCEPLVPKKLGLLIKSGKDGTKIGSGEVRYIAEYAKYQYYNGRRVPAGGRGRKWFGRMKFAHRNALRRIAQEELSR